MDSPGTWEILRATNSQLPQGMGQYKYGHTLRASPLKGIKPGDKGLGRGSESISDLVFGAGSLSALIVLMTSGNAAQVDPVDGKGGIVVQKCSGATRRYFATGKRVYETGTYSRVGGAVAVVCS